MAHWLCHSPCKPGVADSISGFSSLVDEIINQGPVYIMTLATKIKMSSEKFEREELHVFMTEADVPLVFSP